MKYKFGDSVIIHDKQTISDIHSDLLCGLQDRDFSGAFFDRCLAAIESKKPVIVINVQDKGTDMESYDLALTKQGMPFCSLQSEDLIPAP